MSLDRRITNLPAASPLNGTEVMIFVQGGVTKKGVSSDVLSYIVGGGLSTILTYGNNTGPTSIIFDQGVPSTVPVFDAGNHLVSSSISTTVFNYISGLTGNVETRLTNLETGLSWKPIVKIIADANTVSSGLVPLQGYTLQAGDRVLRTAQTTGADNGIWVAAVGAWTRATDFDASSDNIKGSIIPCELGTYADKAFTCTNTGVVVVGTTALTFTLFGGTIYTGAGGRISVSGSTIDIDAAYVGQSSITTLGTITTGTLGAGAKILVGSDATGDIWYNGGSGAISRSAAFSFDGTALNVGTYVTGGTATIYSKGVNTGIALDSSGGGSGTQVAMCGSGTIRSYIGATPTYCLTVYDSTANNLWLSVNNSTGALSTQCIVGTSATPSIVAGAGAGTAPTVTITGTNISGTITVTAGTAPTAGGIVCTVTLSGSFAYPNELSAVISNASSDSVLASAVFCVDTSTSAFKIQEGSGLGLVAGKVYVWKYQVTGR